MRRETEARLRERSVELEVAEWRERTAGLLKRLSDVRDAVELERGRVEALEGCLATRDAVLAEAHAELDATKKQVYGLTAKLARAQADARTVACQWRAVDELEELHFFGPCWREALTDLEAGALGRDPSMDDLVSALHRIAASVPRR